MIQGNNADGAQPSQGASHNLFGEDSAQTTQSALKNFIEKNQHRKSQKARNPSNQLMHPPVQKTGSISSDILNSNPRGSGNYAEFSEHASSNVASITNAMQSVTD